MDAKATVKSADRVLDILELLARSRRPLSHADIADHLHIPKSSLTPLLRNLATRGYLTVEPNGRGHSMGPACLAFAQRPVALADHVLPFLTALTREVGESSALNELRGDEAEVVATVTGNNRLVTQMRLGDRAPLYATSGGKVLLAFQGDEDRRAYLSRVTFVPVTPQTLQTAEAVERELHAVRQTGFAYSHEEFTPGIVGIAVALRDDLGLPLAAINVAMPRARFDAAKRALIEDMLARTCDALKRSL